MLGYMKNVFDIRHGKNLVFAECYPESFFYKKRLPRLSERDGQPHLIFIGMDVLDIFSQIKEIIRRKIHVHVCDTEEASRLKYKTGFLHTFRKFDYNQLFDGTFATFMTQFDACLVTYSARAHATENVEVKEEVKAVNPLEEAWEGINEFLNRAGKDADALSKRLLSDEKFMEDINELVSLGTASFGILLASNVKNEKLKQALLEGAKNVLEKSSWSAKAKTTA
jgi:hypothetical protein